MPATSSYQHVALLVLALCTDAWARISASGGGHRTLRASPPAGPAAAPASAPSASPSFAPASKKIGQFGCEFSETCTCDGVTEYVDCVQDKCNSGKYNCTSLQFTQSCGELSSACHDTLDIHCNPHRLKCIGKYHQAKNGLLGLLIDFDSLESKAYCGPHGKCVGEVDIAVKIHEPEPGVRLQCLMEDEVGDEHADLGLLKLSNGTKAKKSKKKKAVPAKPDSSPPASNSVAEADDDANLKGCSAKVSGDTAGCVMSMPTTLAMGSKIEGLCRLVDDRTDKVLTKDAWFTLKNSAKKVEVEKSKKEKRIADEPAAKGGSKAVAKPCFAGVWAVILLAFKH